MVETLRRPPVANALPAEKFFRPGLSVCPLTCMSHEFRRQIGGARLSLVPQPTAIWTIDRPTSMIDVLLDLKDDLAVVYGEVWSGLLRGGSISRDGGKTFFWAQNSLGKAALGHASWISTKSRVGWFLGIVPEEDLLIRTFDAGHRIMLPKIAILA